MKDLKKIIEKEFPQFASDCVYYDKFIDLIDGKKVSNLTEKEIYKFGKTTMPSNLDGNYMSCIGHEIIKTNEMANESEKKLIEEAENNNGKTKKLEYESNFQFVIN